MLCSIDRISMLDWDSDSDVGELTVIVVENFSFVVVYVRILMLIVPCLPRFSIKVWCREVVWIEKRGVSDPCGLQGATGREDQVRCFYCSSVVIDWISWTIVDWEDIEEIEKRSRRSNFALLPNFIIPIKALKHRPPGAIWIIVAIGSDPHLLHHIVLIPCAS